MVSELDSIPHAQKHRITGFIPEQDFQYIFNEELTFHGAQAKILSALTLEFTREYRRRRAEDTTTSPIQLATNIINGLRFN